MEVQDITPELAESFKLSNTHGVLIAGIVRGGPADKAGVKPGDILIEVDGKPIVDSTVDLATKRLCPQWTTAFCTTLERPEA